MRKKQPIASLSLAIAIAAVVATRCLATSEQTSSPAASAASKSTTTTTSTGSTWINVGITFTKVNEHPSLKEKFRLCVSSLLKYASVNINFYIIGDPESQQIARKIFATTNPYNVTYQIIDLDADQLAKRMNKLVEKMQSHFSYSQTAYYGDALFFLSIGMHKVLIESKIERIIMLDSDLKFKADIAQLYALFDNFTANNLIGIARDAQPVYRHLFWKFVIFFSISINQSATKRLKVGNVLLIDLFYRYTDTDKRTRARE